MRRTRPWARDLADWNALSEALLSFVTHLEGIESLVIAPHGPLHLLPFHALRMSDRRFVAERFTVAYIPSLTALRYLLPAESPTALGATSSVYVAGVAAREDAHPELFERDDALFTSAGWPCRADLGPEAASREAVLAGLAQADVVHLTCHGAFSPGMASRTGLLLAQAGTRPSSSPRDMGPAERRRHLLTVADMQRQASAARLVTLRACSSGLQHMRNAGDDFDSLTRAILAGGARAVAASLWNVDQQSSRQLLSRLYARWREQGTGLADALAQTQREFIESGDPVLAHPYHWAPFAIIGDWR